MMKWIFSGLIVASLVFGVGLGRMDAVSNAAITECGGAVKLAITLAGSMALWSGMMRIAQKAGITERLSRLFAPVVRVLFRGLPPESPAAQAMCLNISANLLGLGNAATPLGIAAMRQLDLLNRHSPEASNYMCMFVVLNTASLQVIPTTTALLRANAGSAAPMEIMPATWVASGASILSGILVAKLLEGRRGNTRQRRGRR